MQISKASDAHRSQRQGAAWLACAALVVMAAPALPVQTARACGGLFCSGGSSSTTQSSFVNQTAERIVFIDHPDDTITAIIQILYEGPADRFAWILPVAGVPDVKVSSNVVLDTLQQQTNPQYQVTTTRLACPPPSGSFGSCPCGRCNFAPAAPTGGGAATSDSGSLGGAAVVVEAAGTIGPYDYTVLSVQLFAIDPAAVAIDWLTANGFDVGELGPEVLRPYLLDGLNLLAFRLSKHAMVGSIRPVMLKYDAEQASIPIRPTAVAANDDMGVLVWVAADAQAVPLSYSSVVLNEALIDWFNPASNYAAVVSAAADQAGGRAFVTEYAGAFVPVVLDPVNSWNEFVAQSFDDWRKQVREAFSRWGTWDGFDDALAAAATLPEGTTLADVTRCLPALRDAAAPGLEDCAALLMPDGERAIDVDMMVFEQKLNELAITPVADSFALLLTRPYLTRLYTTLSPDEMTIDPVFGLNPDLPDASNLHAAQRTAQCGSTVATMQLPQGATIVTDVNGTTWPVQPDQLPAALRVVQHGTSGQGRVLADESASVSGKTFGLAAVCGNFGTAGSGGTTDAPGWPTGTGGATAPVAGSGERGATIRTAVNPGGESEDGGCSAAGGARDHAASVALLLAAIVASRLRRRSRTVPRCGASSPPERGGA